MDENLEQNTAFPSLIDTIESLENDETLKEDFQTIKTFNKKSSVSRHDIQEFEESSGQIGFKLLEKYVPNLSELLVVTDFESNANQFNDQSMVNHETHAD